MSRHVVIEQQFITEESSPLLVTIGAYDHDNFQYFRFASTNDSIQFMLNDQGITIPRNIWETFEAARMYQQEQQEISLHERIPEVLHNEELVPAINSWRHIYGYHPYYDEHGQTINYQFLFPNEEVPTTTETTDGSDTSTPSSLSIATEDIVSETLSNFPTPEMSPSLFDPVQFLRQREVALNISTEDDGSDTLTYIPSPDMSPSLFNIDEYVPQRKPLRCLTNNVEFNQQVCI